MALFSVDFYSKSLFRPVNFKLFVPNDVPPEMKMGNTYYERPTKILVLLHGYNGGNLDWALYSNASEISSKYNLAVILPSGENSFYLDSEATGHKYATFVGQELIDYVRNTFHLSSRKEDTLSAVYLWAVSVQSIQRYNFRTPLKKLFRSPEH